MAETRDLYSLQAPRYDTTRGVSPAVLGPVLAAIDGAPGSAVLDIGGGTGHYAAALRDHGWQVTVVDRSPSMLASAGAKGLATVQADALALPFPDESADAVIMLSMLHQLSDWRTAVAESRRVLRPGGRLAVTLLTAEHIREVTWVYWWFPSMGASALARRPSISELLSECPGGRAIPFEIADVHDTAT
ncbi:MAG: class I SAM-dependent methyltransferase [Solirubrobacteraceae bacterium]